MAENKTKPTQVSVARSVDAVPDETRRADARKLVRIMQEAIGEKPKMWGPSIIGFGTYHYRYESGREGDTPLVGFSPRRNACFMGCWELTALTNCSRSWANLPPEKAVSTLRSWRMWTSKC